MNGGIYTPSIEKRRSFIINTVYVAILVGLVFLVFKYLLGLFWPFILAALFAWILRAPIRWLTAKCHVKYTISVTICLAVFFVIVATLAGLITAKLVTSASDLVGAIPSFYTNQVEPALASLAGEIEDFANHTIPVADDVICEALMNIATSLIQSVSTFTLKADG